MEGLQEAGAQAKSLWGKWSWGRRLTFIGGLLAAGAIIGTTVHYGARPVMVPLMTNLAEEDALEIGQRLRQTNVPFEMGPGGVSILVPENRVHELRMQLASEGLPKGGNVGLELFDEPKIGMSRFAQRLNYNRAIQGELRRTIRAIDTVKDARVHIVAQQRSLFESQKESARASVTLTMHPGRTMSRGQVQAITHLISSAVAGLTPEDVTVVDNRGQILSKGGDKDGLDGSSHEYQRKLERDYELRLTEVLERVVGRDSAQVRVTADVDFTRREVTTENYDPDNFVLRSEQINEEERNGGGEVARGVPGARANLQGVDQNSRGRDAATRRQHTRNYELNKVVKREVYPGAKLKRISVAVILDAMPQENADGTVEYVPRPAEELQRIEDIVKRAIGFSAARGDQLEVLSTPFATHAEAPEPPQKWPSYVRWGWQFGMGLIGVIAFLMMWRRTKKVFAGEFDLINSPTPLREVEAAVTGTLPAGQPEEEISAAQAAAVIRTWLADEAAAEAKQGVA